MPTEFQKEFGGLPLEKTSTLGLRFWDVDKFGRLIGQNRFIWRPGENVAKCEPQIDWNALSTTMPQPSTLRTFFHWTGVVDTPEVHVVGPCTGAEPDCECGFYAYYGVDQASNFGAVGVIQGYGRTTIGRKGFRSMKAEILALVLRENNRRRPSYALGFSTAVGGGPINKEQVRRNYPDVRFFTDEEQMFLEFQPDPPPLIDPDQEGFWDREIEW